jgi:diaminopimelate decarboxylase
MSNLYLSQQRLEFDQPYNVPPENETPAAVRDAETKFIDKTILQYKDRAVQTINLTALEDYLKEAIRAFNPSLGRNTVLAYALKANPGPHILKTFISANKQLSLTGTFDCAGIGEAKLVQICAGDNKYETYLNNSSSGGLKIERALKAGHRQFTIETIGQVIALEICMRNQDINPASITVYIRLILEDAQSSINLNQTFGADSHEAEQIARRLKRAGCQIGVAFHPGSFNLKFTSYFDALAKARRFAKKCKLKLTGINLGGGFSINKPSRSLETRSNTKPKVRPALQFLERFAKSVNIKPEDLISVIPDSPLLQLKTLGTYVKELRDKHTLSRQMIVTAEPGRALLGMDGLDTMKYEGICRLYIPIEQTSIRRDNRDYNRSFGVLKLSGGIYNCGLVDETLSRGKFKYSVRIYDRQSQTYYLCDDPEDLRQKMTVEFMGPTCDSQDNFCKRVLPTELFHTIHQYTTNQPLTQRYWVVLLAGGAYTNTQASTFNSCSLPKVVAYNITPQYHGISTPWHT